MTITAEEAFSVLAGLRREDGRPWGAAADNVQIANARAILDATGPRRHWTGAPRGYGKTETTAGLALAELIVGRIPMSQPAYVAAADRGQAGLVLDSIQGFVDRSTLGSLVEVQSARALHRGTGASIEILAADASGAYGLRPSRLICDELCQWPDTRAARKFYEALSTALPKVATSVGVILTTAGTPTHWSYKVYKQALAEQDLWRVSMIHTAPPWIDPRLVEAEKRALTESAYQRLWCNRWTEAEDALVSAEDLEAAAVLDGPIPPRPDTSYLVTLDVGLVNDRTVLVVAHHEPTAGGRVVCDQLMRWQGSHRHPVDLDEVSDAIADAHRRYPGRIIIDPAKAEHLLQRLQKRELPISQFNFTTTSVGLLAGALLRALRMRTLLLPRDSVLIEELAGVRIVENSAGVPRLDHDHKGHDDHAVALALAVHHLTDGKVAPPSIVWAPDTRRALDGTPLMQQVGPFAMSRADASFFSRLGRRW